jgi:hypothetical protein
MHDQDETQDQKNQNTVKLLRHLFRAFLKYENINVEKSGEILPVYFYGWVAKYMAGANGFEECQTAEVHEETWHRLLEIINGGLAPERLNGLWFAICLGDRPRPKHSIKRIKLSCLIIWEDGKISPMQSIVDDIMLPVPCGFEDGLVCTILRQSVESFVRNIVEKGLDGIHDNQDCKNYRGTTPEDPFDVTMGLILTGISKLRPDLKKPVEDWMRLLQGLSRMPIPAATLAHFQAQRAKRLQDTFKMVRGPARGGFDVGG